MSIIFNVEETLQKFDNFGVSALTEDLLDRLESYIEECDKAMNTGENPLVEDSIYDTLVSILRDARPQSPVLQKVWSEDGEGSAYAYMLDNNPMLSILTIKDMEESKDLDKFIDRMPDEETDYYISYKLNGHGIRVVYDDGKLVSATTRGRSTDGRDITQQLRWLLGEENTSLQGQGVVDVRGELVLPLSRLTEARNYNPGIKSAFSAVSSLIRPSTTKEEVQLLEFLTYGAYPEDFEFDTKSEIYDWLEDNNFKVAKGALVEGVSKDKLYNKMLSVIESMEESAEEYDYFCDGLVFEVDDMSIRDDLGVNGKYGNYAVALKVGRWSQDFYTGFIKDIVWKNGKSRVTPVAVVESEVGSGEGVLTIQGNRVSNVPLHTPRNILILEAYIGSPICFKYGGEAGVVLCKKDGSLLTDDYIKDYMENGGLVY